ncbi:neurosecretory protein VGF [Grus japonensis]|uniref:Neurosecretory protein VGF n=1 Tax=Grus japonensis TaxID=30415 RepID=A0ABC9XU26_GRUJA
MPASPRPLRSAALLLSISLLVQSRPQTSPRPPTESRGGPAAPGGPSPFPPPPPAEPHLGLTKRSLGNHNEVLKDLEELGRLRAEAKRDRQRDRERERDRGWPSSRQLRQQQSLEHRLLERRYEELAESRRQAEAARKAAAEEERLADLASDLLLRYLLRGPGAAVAEDKRSEETEPDDESPDGNGIPAEVNDGLEVNGGFEGDGSEFNGGFEGDGLEVNRGLEVNGGFDGNGGLEDVRGLEDTRGLKVNGGLKVNRGFEGNRGLKVNGDLKVNDGFEGDDGFEGNGGLEDNEILPRDNEILPRDNEIPAGSNEIPPQDPAEVDDLDPGTIDQLIELSSKLHLPADDVVDIIHDVEQKRKKEATVGAPPRLIHPPRPPRPRIRPLSISNQLSARTFLPPPRRRPPPPLQDRELQNYLERVLGGPPRGFP